MYPDIAFVKPEGGFIEVTVQVLEAGMVPDTIQAPFQHHPDTFHAVDVNITGTYVLSGTVVDRAVRILCLKPSIAVQFVRADDTARSTWAASIRCRVAPSVPPISRAKVRPPRSRKPSTACLPTGPRPAFSFLCACLLPCRTLDAGDRA